MKKFLSLFSAVLMAVASVRAEEPASITPLTNGDNSVVIDNPTTGEEWDNDESAYSHYTLFSYTALFSGHVTIYGVGDMDTYGALYNGDMECIDESDDNGPGSNFQFEFDVNAGEVYYIGARGYDDDEIGSYTIHVDGPLAPCEVGSHTMEYVEEIPATCRTKGTKGYYECTTCLHKYSDAEGEEEIDDLVIPAFGHNHNIVDEKCTNEGCGYVVSALPLQIGDNSVAINNPTTGSEWGIDRESYAHYTLFKYTAQTDGGVVIYANGDKDTYGILLDKDLNFIRKSDDGNNYDFALMTDAKTGDVFYIGARGLDDIEIGGYTIMVEEKTTLDAAIGDRNYYTLSSALDDAQDGKTVTLLADIEYIGGNMTEIYTYGTVTLDFNGYTLHGWINNYGHLTIEDSSEGKTGKMITVDDYYLLGNSDSNRSITINGGTFVGGVITSSNGAFYVNGGTFILLEESNFGIVMRGEDNVVFGEGVVYRDLSGEHEDISEITEDVTYSGTFVKAGTPTGIKDVDASKANKAQKTIKTIENGRVVIIRDGVRYDITGRKL